VRRGRIGEVVRGLPKPLIISPRRQATVTAVAEQPAQLHLSVVVVDVQPPSLSTRAADRTTPALDREQLVVAVAMGLDEGAVLIHIRARAGAWCLL